MIKFSKIKEVLLSLTVFVLGTSISIPAVLPKIKVQKNSFKIELNFALIHKDVDAGKFTLRKYNEVSDENCTQQFLLPTKDIFIAIPANSKPLFTVVTMDSKTFQDVVPGRNIKYRDAMEDKTALKKNATTNNKSNENNLYQIIGYTWIRNFYCAHLRIFPVSYDGRLTENYKIVVNVELPGFQLINENSAIRTQSKFDKSLNDIICNAQIAEQFRSNNLQEFPDSTGDWIDYNSMYIKIPITEDGIYRITKNDLDNVGVDVSSIDCPTFRLFESGREIPLYIKGEGDGRLDGTDFIEFYAAKNYSKKSYRAINKNGEPYNNFMNIYTDTSFYFLTWGSNRGVRIPLSTAALQMVPDTIDYHTEVEHYEVDAGFGGLNTDMMKNQDPHWIETDLWFWGGVSSGSQADFSFQTKNLVANKSAKVYLKVIGNASGVILNAHALDLLLNSKVVSSKTISRNERALLVGSVNSNELSNGTNSLSLRNIDNGNTPNSVVYDWFDVEYPQRLFATQNFIHIIFLYDFTPGVKIIKVENFYSPTVSILKLTPQKKLILNYGETNGVLTFSDTISVGDQYVVFADETIHVPSLGKPIKFLNLRNSHNQYDDLIITNPALRNSCEEYAQFVDAKYNLRAKTFYTSDIFNEFGFGYPTAESIREFLKYAYQNWQVPKPSFVFLVGSANYDYKNIYKKTKLNLVPSFGEPVSDVWYVTWGDINSPVQQMWIGRIPASTNDEVRFYLNKHREYLKQNYSFFNKLAIFFSGGDPNTPGQINAFKGGNDYVKNNITDVAPYYMVGVHFYKTSNPRSDFGPYDSKYVQSTIKNGALFISYLGHSGTRVWDNSITQTSDLENDYDRYPLITDLGCSTAKFAEPDVDAFASLFVLNSQAIAYIGNSSLGYTSTSLIAPKYFYESVFTDSVYNISRAHALTKEKMLGQFGSGGTYGLFSLTNTLIGDPIIDLAVPPKPNLVISDGDIEMLSANPDDQMDSVHVQMKIHNYGTQIVNPFKIFVEDTYLGSVIYRDTLNISALQNDAVINSALPVLNSPGQHNILVKLDGDNSIDEIYKSDNSLTFNFDVVSTKTRPYIYSRVSSGISQLTFLSPQKNAELRSNLIAEIDKSPNFKKPITFSIPINTFFTKIDLSQLVNGKRYWMRTKLGANEQLWEQNLSFQKTEHPQKIIYDDSLSFCQLSMEHLTNNGSSISVSIDSSVVSVESAGGNFIKYGSVKLNRINILPNTFNWGMGIAVFDSIGMKIDTTDTFWYGDNPGRAHDLATLINAIPNGKIVAMCAIDDASSNLTLELRNAIKTLGSTLVDNIGFRNPWLLIGTKGANPGDVIEKLETASYQNILTAEKSFVWKNTKGKFITDLVGPAAIWRNAQINASFPSGSRIEYSALGFKQNGEIDTLVLSENNGTVLLNSISSNMYPTLKLIGHVLLSKNGESPVISNLSINYLGVPELGTNYQTVSISSDTLTQGETGSLSFYVYNAGESRADSFKVRVEVIKPDNSREKIFEQMVDSLGAEKRKLFNVSYSTTSTVGSRNFQITIDPGNKILELYKDNNLYSVPFFVKANNAPASVKLTFDGNDIINGDYVSATPNIKVELNDLSPIPISDTSHVRLFLNNKRISLASKEINFSFSDNNPKFVVSYKPTLSDGTYTLKALGTNATGQTIDSAGVVRKFMVSNQAQLLYVYNYPNPFSSETYFTFKLTQIPDELKIKIFTVSGRLIKELIVPPSNLSYDFNRIEWDGRDQD
ncbi:MAG: C25 family cysteine peptidase, partial [Bacteroidetes bacterium]|nr:C25 family cysteine peptidase [Bacteroidota bacterium]